jgi:hypothetical protein
MVYRLKSGGLFEGDLETTLAEIEAELKVADEADKPALKAQLKLLKTAELQVETVSANQLAEEMVKESLPQLFLELWDFTQVLAQKLEELSPGAMTGMMPIPSESAVSKFELTSKKINGILTQK